MSAYVLVEIEVQDLEKMKPYMEKVEATVAEFDGKYLVRGPAAEILEGTHGQYPIKVILEFPTLDVAQAWYQSSTYQEIIGYRTANSECNFMLLPGI